MSDSKLPFARRLLALLAALALAPGLWACSGEEADAASPGGPPGGGAERPPPGVRVEPAERRGLERTVDFSGELLAESVVAVAPDEAGRLDELLVDEGDRVEAGALLGRLDDDRQRSRLREAQAALAIAQARLDQAEAERERQANEVARRRPLAERNAFPEAELASLEDQVTIAAQAVAVAEAGVDQARTAVTSARADLDRREIHAPFAGLVAERHVSAGAVVSAQVPIVTLLDESSLHFVFPLSEQRLDLVSPGTRATVRLDAFPGHTFQGEVWRVGGLIDRTSRTVDVKLTLDPGELQLRHGMFGRGLLVAESVTDAVVVPPEALQETRGELPRVWTVADGLAQPVDVHVLLATQDGVAVDGLADGTQVIVSPPMGLAPGGPVYVVGGGPVAAGPAGASEALGGESGEAPAGTGDASERAAEGSGARAGGAP